MKATQHATRDAQYLREYADFSSHGHIVIAECLHRTLLTALQNKDFETVAHLQVRLHAELVQCMETAGALLRAYSRWGGKNGLLGDLLSYRPGDVPRFMKELHESNDALTLLRFPSKQDVIEHAGDDSIVGEAYSNDELKKMIFHTCEIYLSEPVRKAYNKIKHAGLYIGHPAVVSTAAPQTVPSSHVYVILDLDAANQIETAAFSITGEKARTLSNNYLARIRALSKHSAAVARFVAYFLERNLMT